MLSTTPSVAREDFERATGWTFKPEGACKGDVCIPLQSQPGERVDLVSLGEAMGLPLVSEPEQKLWALGPESIGARALVSAQAPDLVLPDVEGRPFDLASLRGKKVLVYAWAPY